MKRIAVYTVKGGTGKSTIARVLADGFAKKGWKDLFVEVDGQGNSSKQYQDESVSAVLLDDDESYRNLKEDQKRKLFIDKFINQGIYDGTAAVFADPRKVQEVIQPTNRKNVDMIAANLQLFMTDVKLRLEDGRQENRLKRALNFIKNDYDCCVFDCSPVKSLLINNVMYTDPLVLIPVIPADDAMQGLALVLNELQATKEIYEELELDYRIVIMMRSANNEMRNNIRYIRKVFGDKVLNSEIRYQAKPIEDASKRRKSILDYKSSVSDDFMQLVEEVYELCKTS